MGEDLKSIFIAGGREPFWTSVKESLAGISATVFSINDDTDFDMLESMKPSLLIMGLDSYLKMPVGTDSLMKVIVKEEGPPLQFPEEGIARRTAVIVWPAEARVFVDLVSKLLHVSPRRYFKTLIKILPRGTTFTYLGESEDFSSTGIGFRTAHEIRQGEKVEISFYVPTNRQAASFEVEVVRCVPDDGLSRYGARYVNLAPHTEEMMDDFIRNI